MSLQNFLLDKTCVLSARPYSLKKLYSIAYAKSPVLVAISGESAAGKSTFLKTLSGIVKKAAFIDADHYFNDISDRIHQFGSFTKLVENGYESDAPSSFLLNQMAQDLKNLKQGKKVRIPLYEMKTGISIPQAQTVNPSPLIFVAGICTFYQPVVSLFDFKIYLEADPQLQLERYLNRAGERGQSREEALRQFKHVTLMAQKYIVPTKSMADVVIKGRLPRRLLKHMFIDTVRGINRS